MSNTPQPTIHISEEEVRKFREMGEAAYIATLYDQIQTQLKAALLNVYGHQESDVLTEWLYKRGYSIGQPGNIFAVVSTKDGEPLGKFEYYEQALGFVLERIDTDTAALKQGQS